MNNKSIIITVAVALIVGGAGFYGGTVYEKNSLAAQNQGGMMTPGGNFAGRNGGAQGQGQNRGGMRNGGGFLTGKITAKDDKSITVQDRNGSSKIVLYSASATVGKSVDGALSDLATGQNVMVNGTANSDGSVTAQNIQIRPAAPQDTAGAVPAGAPTN